MTVFQKVYLPLTPSFVGDAIAPAANNRYSVPYESSYPSQLCTVLRISNAKSCIFLLLYICLSSQILPEKADWGEIGE